MTDQDAREWAGYAIISAGLLLYVLTHVWMPTQLVVGPVHLGASAGDCHGVSGPDKTVYVGVCK